jgi:hypothetical protein
VRHLRPGGMQPHHPDAEPPPEGADRDIWHIVREDVIVKTSPGAGVKLAAAGTVISHERAAALGLITPRAAAVAEAPPHRPSRPASARPSRARTARSRKARTADARHDRPLPRHHRRPHDPRGRRRRCAGRRGRSPRGAPRAQAGVGRAHRAHAPDARLVSVAARHPDHRRARCLRRRRPSPARLGRDRLPVRPDELADQRRRPHVYRRLGRAHGQPGRDEPPADLHRGRPRLGRVPDRPPGPRCRRARHPEGATSLSLGDAAVSFGPKGAVATAPAEARIKWSPRTLGYKWMRIGGDLCWY